MFSLFISLIFKRQKTAFQEPNPLKKFSYKNYFPDFQVKVQVKVVHLRSSQLRLVYLKLVELMLVKSNLVFLKLVHLRSSQLRLGYLKLVESMLVKSNLVFLKLVHLKSPHWSH